MKPELQSSTPGLVLLVPRGLEIYTGICLSSTYSLILLFYRQNNWLDHEKYDRVRIPCEKEDKGITIN